MEETIKGSWEDTGKLIFRVTVAGLLLFHGVSKILNGIPGIVHGITSIHLPAFVAYGVYIGEVVAPILILIGLWARPAGLVVVIDLIVAIALVAHTRTFTMSRGGGWGIESEAFYLLGGLAVFFLGAGRFSVAKARHWWS